MSQDGNFTNVERNSMKFSAHTNTGWKQHSSFVLLEINFAPSSGKNVWHIDVIKDTYKKRHLYSEVFIFFPRSDLAK